MEGKGRSIFKYATGLIPLEPRVFLLMVTYISKEHILVICGVDLPRTQKTTFFKSSAAKTSRLVRPYVSVYSSARPVGKKYYLWGAALEVLGRPPTD
jgi:hypothetical protein